MRASTVERRRTETEARILEYLISIADPKTGRVAVSGTSLADEVGVGSQTARAYLAGMVKDGTLVQISEIKRGNPTLYRIPAMVRGDVVTHYDKVFLPNDDNVFDTTQLSVDHSKLPFLAGGPLPMPTAEELARLTSSPPIEVVEETADAEALEMQKKYHEWKAHQEKVKAAGVEALFEPRVSCTNTIDALYMAKEALRSTDYVVSQMVENFLRTRRALEDLIKEVEDGRHR